MPLTFTNASLSLKITWVSLANDNCEPSKNGIAECLAELRQHLGVGVKLLGLHIGVENGNALTLEERRDIRLPSSYSSCDGNGNHGCYAK